MVIDWLEPIAAHLKAVHVTMLSLWCAGLFALPMMLAHHDPAVSQTEFKRIRRATHYGYTFVVTPAGLFTIGSGVLLVFLRETFVPWMFFKLIFVALLVAFHAWVSYVLVAVAETEGSHAPPGPLIPLMFLMIPILAILGLVLAKSDLHVPMPGWLLEPRDGHLPFDVPRL